MLPLYFSKRLTSDKRFCTTDFLQGLARICRITRQEQDFRILSEFCAPVLRVEIQEIDGSDAEIRIFRRIQA